MLCHSFDTIDSSYVGVDEGSSLLDGARSDNVAMWDDAADDTGVVTDEEVQHQDEREDPDDLMDTGVLIVPPGGATTQTQPTIGIEERTYDLNPTHSPLNLSVPDSVPSNVASLMLPEQSVAGPATQNSTTASAPEQNFARTLLCAVALLMIIGALGLPTVYLVRERNELRSTTVRLQEQIRALQKQVESDKAQSTLRLQERLHEQLRFLQDEINKASKAESAPPPDGGPTFSWSQAANSFDDSGGPNSGSSSRRIDNCWLRADATVELGECAVHTKRTVNKKLKKLGKRIGQELWRAQEEFFGKMETLKEQYFASDLYQTISQMQEKNATNPDGKDSTKRNLKSFGKVAASVLSGFAFASAATLIASGTFLDKFGSDSNDDSSTY